MKASSVALSDQPKPIYIPQPKRRLDTLRALRTNLRPYFETKNAVLYCADYREVLPHLTPGFVDTVITDPPYGITNLGWDRAVDWPWFWDHIHCATRPTSPIVIFASGKFVNLLINSNPKNFRYDLIWEKNLAVGFLSANQRPLRSHENILIFARRLKGSTYIPQMVKGKPHKRGGTGRRPRHYGGIAKLLPATETNLYHPRSVLRFPNRTGKRSLHPTQKNLELMEWLVRTYSDRRHTILDPFVGSGTTAVAAVRNGRKVIAIDSDEASCEVAARRIEARE